MRWQGSEENYRVLSRHVLYSQWMICGSFGFLNCYPSAHRDKEAILYWKERLASTTGAICRVYPYYILVHCIFGQNLQTQLKPQRHFDRVDGTIRIYFAIFGFQFPSAKR